MCVFWNWQKIGYWLQFVLIEKIQDLNFLNFVPIDRTDAKSWNAIFVVWSDSELAWSTRGGTGGSNRGPAATTTAPPAIAQFVYRGIGDRTIFTGRPLLSPSIWSRFFWAQRSCENLTKASGTEETAKKSCSKMVEIFLRGFSLFA